MIIVYIPLNVSCQTDSLIKEKQTYVTPFPCKSKYLNYLLNPDENSQAALMSISWQYLYAPQSKTFTIGGMHLNVGLNLARFFTKKFIFGICYDLKEFDGFTKQHFSQQFVNDFNYNFIPTYSNAKDSAIAYTLKGGINKESGFGTIGNTFENIGISFSPFPQKYGGILIQIKKGNRVFPYWGIYTNKLLSKDDGSNIYLQLNNCYSFEVCFKPYKFFNSKRTELNNLKGKDFYKFIVVSLYYERITLKNATFDDKPLSEIVNKDFITKYNTDDHFGIKIGFGIY
ncbi:MAG: hypothetical protein ACXVP4_01455 [Bacteroidia bacterium]